MLRHDPTLSKLAVVLSVGALGTACQEIREEWNEQDPLPSFEQSESASAAPDDSNRGSPEARSVVTSINGKSGSSLSGQATLTEVDGGVEVAVTLYSAEPGLHALHIHQKADCSASDATSAGGHFAPRDHDHGMPEEDEHHLGDLGNIEVSQDGTAEAEVVAKNATLVPGGDRSFLGRAIMVHAKQDDGGQPAGNAGRRVGCGEIPAESQMKVGTAM